MNTAADLPFVSIVIPVYNGEKYIEKCFACLQNQNYPGEKYEIIMVDNNSSDRTARIIKQLKLKSVSCHKKGPSAARNAGIKAAKGDILLFIDVDCLAKADLIMQHVKNHLHCRSTGSKIKIIGGAIGGYNKNYWSVCDDICSWCRNHPALKPRIEFRFAPTANLSVDRSVFDSIGYFDEDMHYGEDVAFCRQAINKGIAIYFQPAAEVLHINRSTFKGFLSRAWEWAAGDSLLLRKKIFRINYGIRSVYFNLYNLIYTLIEPIYCALKIRRFEFIFYLPFIFLNRVIFRYYVVKGIRKLKRELKNKN